jgi:hypothetical protein
MRYSTHSQKKYFCTKIYEAHFLVILTFFQVVIHRMRGSRACYSKHAYQVVVCRMTLINMRGTLHKYQVHGRTLGSLSAHKYQVIIKKNSGDIDLVKYVRI